MEGKTGGGETGGWKKVKAGARVGEGSERARGSSERRGGEVSQERQLPCRGARRATLEKGGLEYFWDRGLNVISFAMAGCTLAPTIHRVLRNHEGGTAAARLP